MRWFSHVAHRYHKYSKRRAIKTTRVRPWRRHVCGSQYREGGHCRRGQAEEPNPDAPRLSLSQDCCRRQQAAQKSNRAPALKEPPRKMPAGRVVARRSVRRRRSQRSGRHVDRAPGRSRGGSRGARPAKRAVEKGSARHDPDASWPRGPNFQCKPGNLRFAVSHSRLKNDFMYMYVDIPF